MADTKITALTALTAADPSTDVLPIVDTSDTTMAASGTTKKISINNILGASGTATLASATISGDLTVDTSTLKVDSANNRVGIGTASPSKPLEVYNTTESTVWANTTTGIALFRAGGTGGDFYFGIDNSTGGGFGQGNYSRLIYSTGAYPIIFSSNASERYRIASDGVATWSNVGGVAGTAMTLDSTGLGIGASPSDKLTVSGGASFTAFAINANPINFTGTSQSFARFRNAGGDFYYGIEGSVGGTFFTGSTAYAACFLTGNTPIQFITNGALRATIDTSGNVGIGVTPSAWNSSAKAFEIGTAGNSVFSSAATFVEMTNNAYLDSVSNWVRVNTGNGAARFRTSGSGFLWSQAAAGANPITWTQAMTLDASGNLLVGLTAAGTTAAKTIQIANGTAPTANVAGGQLYVEAGALKYRGSSGTVTTIANA